MGNRAVIRFGYGDDALGIYLHWNGGEESVKAFLDAAKEYGVRGPEGDRSYCVARVAQIIGNFFGGTTSVGVDLARKLDEDNGDNGTFVVGKNFEIEKKLHVPERSEPREFDQKYYAGVLQEVRAANDPIFKRKEEPVS